MVWRMREYCCGFLEPVAGAVEDGGWGWGEWEFSCSAVRSRFEALLKVERREVERSAKEDEERLSGLCRCERRPRLGLWEVDILDRWVERDDGGDEREVVRSGGGGCEGEVIVWWEEK